MMKSKKLKLRYHSVQVIQPEPKQVKTPSVTAKEEIDHIIHEVVHQERYYGKQVGEWTDRFNKNPADALSWSQDIFTAAGKLHGCQWMTESMRLINENKDEYSVVGDHKMIQILRDRLYDEVTRKAKWPDSSTSQPSNFISLCVNAAKAEWLERLDRSLARIAGKEV